MFKNHTLLLALVSLLMGISQAQALVLTEDFEAAFPTWESSWLGSNSNIGNYYGDGAGRGNNPDGLWIVDGLSNGSNVAITFNSLFASTITSFSIDTTSWDRSAVFEAFDMSGNSLISTAITSYAGAYSNPGTYQTIAFTSSNGVAGFNIFGNRVEGNTSIDNVVVTTGAVSVPEPASMVLFGLGLAGLVLSRRRQNG